MNNEHSKISTPQSANHLPMGPHILKFLDSLKESYWEADEKIKKIQENKSLFDYQKKERIKGLKKYQEEVEKAFNHLCVDVETWVSQFPEKDAKYGDIIVEYYCNIINYVPKKKEPLLGALSLQDILDEVLTENNDKNKRDSAFKARIRQINLNMIQKL